MPKFRSAFNVLNGIAVGLAVTLALPAVGHAPAERPTRPGSETPARAAVTALASLYAEFGAMSAEGVDIILCGKGPAGDIIAGAARPLFHQRYGNTLRPARLEDAERLQLAIELAAAVDGIEAEAVRKDEAIGPGVYRPVILLFSGILERCKSLRT